MSTREILTLQFGHYANFVGTHWWNLQENSFQYDPTITDEINHDVLFREGLTPKGGVTFTPRALLVDLKGSLKTLSETGDLYELKPDPKKLEINWDDKSIEVKTEEKVAKNEFQTDLENAASSSNVINKKYTFEKDVKVWSDFLYTRFHPRTVNIIKEYQHENDDSPFDVFPLGTQLWNSKYFDEDFSDNIRNYVEECDSIQGFHILQDATNAFSGLATSCIQHLKDEYNTKSVLAFPFIPAYYRDYLYTTDEDSQKSTTKDSVRLLNLALGFNALAEHSSLFVPLCTSKTGWRQPGPKQEFQHISYDHTIPYHTSAILASALDTYTLQHRLKATHFSLSDLCADLNVHGRKIATGSLRLPFSINKGADLIDCLDNWDGPLTQSLTPSCTIGTDRIMQMITLRGISENQLKRPPPQAGKQRAMPAYRCNSVHEMLSMYLSCNCFGTASNVTTVKKGLSVKNPFPRIFNQDVDIDGSISRIPRSDNIDVETVPVLGGLHSGPEIGVMLEKLHTDTRRIKFQRFHQFTTAGLETDEFNDCLDKLFDLRECYEENYYL